MLPLSGNKVAGFFHPPSQKYHVNRFDFHFYGNSIFTLLCQRHGVCVCFRKHTSILLLFINIHSWTYAHVEDAEYYDHLLDNVAKG